MMKKILIINLTRMGDQVQSIPLLTGLKKRYPRSCQTLLVNNAFSYVCGSIPDIDRYIEFDFDRLYVDIISPESDLAEAYIYLDELFGEIRRQKYDLVINLTPSRLAAVAAFLAHGKETMGITLDPEGYRLIKHPWMNYLQATCLYGDLNSFNLVDLFAKGGGINPGEGEYSLKIADKEQEWAKQLLKAEGVHSSERLIGFQLGASTAKKRWPVELFANLANLLSKKYPLRVVLFGTEGERELATSFKKLANIPCIDVMGKTDFGQLAALIKKVEVLVTNDTGTMHIAAAVDTRIVSIFLGSVTCFNTGPYQKGAWAVHPRIPCFPCDDQAKCPDFRCHQMVAPELIEILVSSILDKRSFCCTDSGWWNSIDLFRADFDEDNMIEFLPVFKRPITDKDFFNHLTREMWKFFLDKRPNLHIVTSKDDLQPIIERLKRRLFYYQIEPGNDGNRHIEDGIEWIERLKRLGAEGVTFSKRLIGEAKKSPLPIKVIKDLNEGLNRINEEISRVGMICKVLSSVVQMHQFERENMQGDDLPGLSEQSLAIYRNIYLQCQLLHAVSSRFLNPKSQTLQYGPR